MLIMKTRIQKLLVGAALVVAATLAQAQFNYTDNGNGTCTITGYTGPGGAVTIPNSIAGLSVVSIGNMAFYNKSSVTSVTIPDGVVSIGSGVFEYSGLTSVTIGNGVTSIGYAAFANCYNLTSVLIPASVTSIGNAAFIFCTSLTAITVDAANSFYSSASGVLFDKNQTTLIVFPGGRGGSFAIPASVTSIGYAAFHSCSSLTSIAIPASVTSIGDYAFLDCGSLTSVTIGNGVTSIGAEAFWDCASLTSVTIPASVTSIGQAAFGACYSLTAAYFLGNAPPDPGEVFDDGYVYPLYDPVIIYYLPGATGWRPLFSFRPTEPWDPQASALGVIGGHFGFNITGPANTVIVVEACTNLTHPVWLPVSTNVLDGSGASSFSDPQSPSYPTRFYRFRSP
jgi:hypothetical protein